jgi:hypothetical protein
MAAENREKSLLSRAFELVNRAFAQKKANDDNFVTLLSVAHDSPQIRVQLLSILRHTPFQRKSLINTWLEDLKLAGAPRELQNALSALLDEDVADRALLLLQESSS